MTTKLRDKFLPNRGGDGEPEKFETETVDFITKYKDYLLKRPYRKRMCYAGINTMYKTKDKKV